MSARFSPLARLVVLDDDELSPRSSCTQTPDTFATAASSLSLSDPNRKCQSSLVSPATLSPPRKPLSPLTNSWGDGGNFAASAEHNSGTSEQLPRPPLYSRPGTWAHIPVEPQFQQTPTHKAAAEADVRELQASKPASVLRVLFRPAFGRQFSPERCQRALSIDGSDAGRAARPRLGRAAQAGSGGAAHPERCSVRGQPQAAG
jgi:hypothetical protein